MNTKYQHQAFDGLLVMQCQNGDQKAFNLLVKRWHSRLLRHAIRVLKDGETSKDIVQDSWISISKGIGRLKNPSHFGPWALRIVYHKAIDHLRKQKTRVVGWEPESKDEGKENNINIVLAKLKELPENHRMILSMFYLEEMPVAEIAFVLKVPPGTVKSRLYNAREYFRKNLKIERHEK